MVATVAAQAIEVGDTARMVDLDEVIVVAQPKEQVRLRLQPVSSSVFDSEQMNRLGVRDLNQLSQYVPSFDMPAYGSRITSTMYMRGIGARINNTSVGVYYDNIPLMSKSAFNNHFYMLDRVDVLRGPQGTLYGRNSMAGLMVLESFSPSGGEERFAFAEYGGGGTFRAGMKTDRPLGCCMRLDHVLEGLSSRAEQTETACQGQRDIEVFGFLFQQLRLVDDFLQG